MIIRDYLIVQSSASIKYIFMQYLNKFDLFLSHNIGIYIYLLKTKHTVLCGKFDICCIANTYLDLTEFLELYKKLYKKMFGLLSLLIEFAD